MEFIKYISTKKALYATSSGLKIKRISVLPVVLNKDELTLYKRYKNSAKSRNKTFELSTTTFKRLIYSKCYYCGIEPRQKVGDIQYNGIDRLNNDDGYHIENCLACCKVCNRGKGTMSSEEYVEHLTRVAQLLIPQYEAYRLGDLELTKKLRKEQLKNAGVFSLN